MCKYCNFPEPLEQIRQDYPEYEECTCLCDSTLYPVPSMIGTATKCGSCGHELHYEWY